MAISDDFSIAADGSIRYVGTTSNYTVIQLHRWLGDLMDDAVASGNDILDITDATASERSTDNIITLKYPYNIDDIASQHLFDGSIIQSRTSGNLGEDIYDGILVFANAGAYLYIMQNNKFASPNFWTTGINADATNGISHRFMLKVRDNGTDIDLRRVIGMTREFGYTFSEFKINSTSRGNNVLALTYASDLNNTTIASTVKAWTAITNTEGYRALDVNGDTSNEYYYSEWNKDTYSINQFYERIKWLTRRSTTEDLNTDTGTDYAVGNATIIRQGQSFTNGVVPQYLTRAHFRLKKIGAPTGNLTVALYAHSGVYGTSSIGTGVSLATSATFDVSKLTTSYLEKEIAFTTMYEMAASTNYVLAVEYSGGDGSNYVHVEGAAAGTHGGNNASYTGSWSAAAAADLWFQAYSSPKLYGIPAELVRGITHEVTLTTPRSGSFSATELVSWGTGPTSGTGLMYAIDSTTAGTKMWIQLLTGAAPSASVTITGVSTAFATNSGSPTERTLSFPLAGASTGSAIIGSYGFGIEPAHLTASDKLFDLTNTQRTPPNNVTFTVGGLFVGEDRVLVGPAAGGVLDEDQFTIDATYSGGSVTSIQVSPAIPTDTPSSGTIRVQCNSGIYKRIAYSSYTGDIFTVTSTDFSGDNATSANNCFISYIDDIAGATSMSFTSVYLADRSLFIRVRDGGTEGDLAPIKTFETTGTLGSAGGSATAIRNPDV
jgi:hypothetical protein